MQQFVIVYNYLGDNHIAVHFKMYENLQAAIEDNSIDDNDCRQIILPVPPESESEGTYGVLEGHWVGTVLGDGTMTGERR
jgi:hypothetical protein